MKAYVTKFLDYLIIIEIAQFICWHFIDRDSNGWMNWKGQLVFVAVSLIFALGETLYKRYKLNHNNN